MGGHGSARRHPTQKGKGVLKEQTQEEEEGLRTSFEANLQQLSEHIQQLRDLKEETFSTVKERIRLYRRRYKAHQNDYWYTAQLELTNWGKQLEELIT